MSDEEFTRIISNKPQADSTPTHVPKQNQVADLAHNDDGKTTIVRGGGSPAPNPAHPEPQSFGRQRPTASGASEATQIYSNPHETAASQAAGEVHYEMVVGWLVIVGGKGKGCTREIFFGMNSLGRDASERIPLNFGDTNISRLSHAYVVYDEKQNEYYIQHGGKANLIRLNDKPVLTAMELSHGDIIEIGDTKLMFVPLCSEKFQWNALENK